MAAVAGSAKCRVAGLPHRPVPPRPDRATAPACAAVPARRRPDQSMPATTTAPSAGLTLFRRARHPPSRRHRLCLSAPLPSATAIKCAAHSAPSARRRHRARSRRRVFLFFFCLLGGCDRRLTLWTVPVLPTGLGAPPEAGSRGRGRDVGGARQCPNESSASPSFAGARRPGHLSKRTARNCIRRPVWIRTS